MRMWWATVVLCVLVAWHDVAAQGTGAAQPVQEELTRDAEGLYKLIAEYTRNVGTNAAAPYSGYAPAPPAAQIPPVWPNWIHPFALQVTQRNRENNVVAQPVPLLVLPVPVPVAAPSPRVDPAQCQLSGASAPAPYPELGSSTYHTPAQTLPEPAPALRPAPAPAPEPAPVPLPTFAPIPSFAPRPKHPKPTSGPAHRRPPTRRPDPEERIARSAPKLPPIEDSRVLVEQFRAQQPSDPSQPPILIDPVGVVSTDDYTLDELLAMGAAPPDSQRTPPSIDEIAGEEPAPTKRLKCRRVRAMATDAREEGSTAPPPPLPRFERSLFMRARLTVRRAGYTEPYTVWWDAATGASRVDLHGGTTSGYRMIKRDGQMQSVLIREDRTGESNVRRCVVTQPRRATLAERALPALPDLQAFSFAGLAVRGSSRVERWRHTLSGHSGELGAARGEALTFRHELLVARSPDNYTTTPLRYSVNVDSSVLGPDSDSYVHYFDEVRTKSHDPAMFFLDIADACEYVELTEDMESVEPLREFTMLYRAPGYDTELQRYKRLYDRQYLDDVEEAVRKNVLIQTMRHVKSANRQGASFEENINWLSDRLQVELNRLLGVVQTESDTDGGDMFPHPRTELNAMRGRMPRQFDWRERGAVTPVRFQGADCASCWAFATTGAVEGALFVNTGRLVPLSEQALVDCAHTYGANGCKGTWPSYAYNYIKFEGLPALEDYSYQAKKLQCRADSIPQVTKISGHLNVTRDNILALKVAIRKYGPTAVIIDGQATSFINYAPKKNPYYYDGHCRKNSANHAVLAVGWTVHRGETYFILKNSWSTAWGADGYIYMRANTNTCGVLRHPSVPRLTPRDVLRVPAGAPAAAAPLPAL